MQMEPHGVEFLISVGEDHLCPTPFDARSVAAHKRRSTTRLVVAVPVWPKSVKTLGMRESSTRATVTLKTNAIQSAYNSI